MYKKIISGLLALTLTVGAVALPAVDSGLKFSSSITASAGGNVGIYPFMSGDYKYTVLSDGTIEISKYTGSDTEVSIPSEIDGKSVTRIGDWVFSCCDNLTSVTIPSSVTSIGYYAFSSCENLTDITIPKSVTSIESGAFAYTKWLENKQNENPLVVINGILIDGTTCKGSVTIPSTVTSIVDEAFYANQDITSVNIPDSVTEIGSRAFNYCLALFDIEISATVTTIGSGAFSYTKWIENKQSENPLVIVNNIVVDGKNCTGDVKIPNGVTQIGAEAFANCTEITSVTMPNGVTEIGACAFQYCYNLTSVTFADSLINIGGYGFSDCTQLTDIDLPNGLESVGELAFAYCGNLADISIPESLTSIGNGAFAGTKWYTEQTQKNSYVVVNGILIESDVTTGKITIPDNVSSISERLYWGSEVSEVYIPQNVITIGELAFKSCSNITKLTISEGVKYIESGAFYDCYNVFKDSTGLTSVTIPKSVVKIGSQAFGYMYDYETGYTGKVSNFKIYCYANTAGESYAKENGFDYELITDTTSITSATVENISAKTYTGSAIKPAPTVKVGTTTLKNGTDYTISYKNNSNVGTATVIITGKGNYTGTIKKTFKIKAASISKATVASVSNKSYTGKAIKPAPSVKLNGKTLKKGTDYTLSYKNNVKTGKATITITGKGNYTGTITKTFYIVPKKATLSSVKSTKTKTVTVKWKKDTQATGYQIVYATNSKFTSGKKTVTVTENSTVSKTISKLTKGKTYYVKVRSYKTIGSKKVCGAYSAVKKVKCK